MLSAANNTFTGCYLCLLLLMQIKDKILSVILFAGQSISKRLCCWCQDRLVQSARCLAVFVFLLVKGHKLDFLLLLFLQFHCSYHHPYLPVVKHFFLNIKIWCFVCILYSTLDIQYSLYCHTQDKPPVLIMDKLITNCL